MSEMACDPERGVARDLSGTAGLGPRCRVFVSRADRRTSPCSSRTSPACDCRRQSVFGTIGWLAVKPPYVIPFSIGDVFLFQSVFANASEVVLGPPSAYVLKAP